MSKILTTGILMILIVAGIFIGLSYKKQGKILGHSIYDLEGKTDENEKPIVTCGNGICSLTEDCNVCVEDCGCKSGEYCNELGICKKGEVCGDEICSEQEKVNNNCCEDCGCEGDRICNKITQKCQEKIITSENMINKVVRGYLVENSLTGTIKKISDSYYGQEIIKVVSIDCGTPESEYPCEIILFIDKEEKIIDEMRTT